MKAKVLCTVSEGQVSREIYRNSLAVKRCNLYILFVFFLFLVKT